MSLSLLPESTSNASFFTQISSTEERESSIFGIQPSTELALAKPPQVSTTDSYQQYVNSKLKSVSFIPNISSYQSDIPSMVTGSWDQALNSVDLYDYTQISPDQLELESDFSPELPSEAIQLQSSVQHKGDVSCIKPWYHRPSEKLSVLSCSSTGQLNLFEVDQNNRRLQASGAYQISNYNLTSMDVDELSSTVIVSSENGLLYHGSIFDLSSGTKSLRAISAESTSINKVQFIGSSSTFGTVGSCPRGLLKIYNLQSRHPDQACQEMRDNGPTHQYTTFTSHPTRPEIILTGSSNGVICCWDRRYSQTPVFRHQVHDEVIRNIRLHPLHPQLVYSCSDDGTIKSLNLSSSNDPFSGEPGVVQSPAVLHHSVLGWNDFDIDAHSNTLIAGSDSNCLLIYDLNPSTEMQ